MNDNITVSPGQTLNTDHFPRFGSHRETPQTAAKRVSRVNQPKTSERMDMFGSSKHIANQICELLDKPTGATLQQSLAAATDRDHIVSACQNKGFITDQQCDKLRDLLERLHTATVAYGKHRARNVFNDAYSDWWYWIGTQIKAPTKGGRA